MPICRFSHGDGPSLYLPSKDGYGPLTNFYAEQGFVVVQPSHANSKVAGLPRLDRDWALTRLLKSCEGNGIKSPRYRDIAFALTESAKTVYG